MGCVYMTKQQSDIALSLYARMTLSQLEATRQNLIEGLAVLDDVIAKRKQAEHCLDVVIDP